MNTSVHSGSGRTSKAPPPPPPKTYKVQDATLRTLLRLELLQRGQVEDLNAAHKVVSPLSEAVLVTWLEQLGHKIG